MTEEIWLPRQEMWLAGVLQEELVRLGVRQPLAVRVAAVWAETAKSVVTAHKRVAGEVGGMEWELARDISTGDETVQLSLSQTNSQTILLTFTPIQLMELFLKLETCQKAVDGICK